MQPYRGTEVLLEISLRIGASLDLEDMLRDTVADVMRLLDCNVAQVLQAEADNTDETLHWQPLLTFPHSPSPPLVPLDFVQRVGLPTTRNQWHDWAQRLPFRREEASRANFLFDLPDFGAIALEKDGDLWDEEFIRSLAMLFKKLGHAAMACIATAENLRRRKELETRNASLSMIAQGRPLSEVLGALCRFTEEMDADIRSSIMLYDAERNLLFPAAAPSLPEDFNALLAHGVPVAPRAGSCGTAAFTRKLAVAEDIQNDPCWTPHPAYMEAARTHELKACWSIPILSSTGAVLGTLANYSRRMGGPAPENLRFAAWAIDIAALAIEGQQDKDALYKSEEKNRALLDAIPDMIFVIDRDGYFADFSCSQQDPNLLLKPEEFLGRHVRDVLPEALATLTMQVLERLIATKEIQQYEYPLELPDGTRWYEERAVLVGKDQMLTIVRDITEHKKQRERLCFQSQVLNCVNEAIVVTNLDGVVLYWGRGAERLYGYSAEEVLGRYYREFAGSIEIGDDVALKQHILNNGSWSAEHKQRRKDGTEFWSSTYIFVLRTADGEPTGFVGLDHDITERKKADEDLRRSEQRFKALLQNVATVAVQGYTLDGTIRYWNHASETFYGYTAKEAIGQKLLELGFVPEALHDGLLDDFRRIGETGELPPAHELELVHKDGSLIPVYSSYALVNVPGEELEIFCIDVDLRDQKRVEAEREQLRHQCAQAQKMESIGRLAGGVAHDFNNMLMVIIGEAEMAIEQTDVGERLRDGLREIKTAAQRSADLTRQLLAFARKQTIAPRVLDLNETITGMLKMLRRLIGEHIVLDWRPGEQLERVLIDPSQVGQILTNLCINARDAITGSGTIGIETRNVSMGQPVTGLEDTIPPGDYVRLSVSDDGCGMALDAEFRSRLFDPFFTTKETGQGTGLGLSTIYGIVKQNQGYIEVESEPGRGSVFKIFLSVCTTQERPQPGPIRAPNASFEPAATILVVEDEPAILATTVRILQRLGYTVLPADTPGKAIQLAREHRGRIDLLITDVVMPEMNGGVLAKNLVAMYPNIKSLFMSGYTADIIANQGVLEEGVQFLQKPFGKRQLAEKIEDILVDSLAGEA